jgi:hypothetical protein
VPSPFRIHRARLALAGTLVAAALAVAPRVAAQAPLPDALSVSIVGGAGAGRASLRLRIERAPSGAVDVVASGIVVAGRRRVTAELRTDTLLAVRRYVAETRDSAGVVVDRIEVATAGGRLLLTRTAPGHRMVREFPVVRALLLRDDEGLVPLLVAAARGDASLLRDAVPVLDVRTGRMGRGIATLEPRQPLNIAEVPLEAVPVTLRLADGAPFAWWRDARGRLLFAPLAGTRQLRRDDPPG